MKRTFFLTQFALIVLAPILVWALETTPPEKIASAHPDLVVWVFGLVLAGFLFLLWRLIDRNDKEHTAMLAAMKEDSEKKWRAIGELSQTLHHLQGEHDVLKGVHLHRRVDDQ